MNNLALAILDGNLTADPELKELRDDKVVASFTIAMNHEYGKQTDENKFVSFLPVECWDRLAVNCGKFLKKGSRVTVTGSIRQDRWKDGDGNSRSRVKVIAQTVRFDHTPKRSGSTPETVAA